MNDLERLQNGFLKLLQHQYDRVNGKEAMHADNEKAFLETLCRDTLRKEIYEVAY